MSEVTEFIAYILSSAGLTILLVWPSGGPTAWIRERMLRAVLRGKAADVLDCYICSGFWMGLLLSPVWWFVCHRFWCWTGCFITPYLFWVHLRPDADRGPEENKTGES
jgi:hypothetical protein